jgi:hypothetical protein
MPTTATPTFDLAAEYARLGRRRDSFARCYGVRPFQWSTANIVRFLRAAWVAPRQGDQPYPYGDPVGDPEAVAALLGKAPRRGVIPWGFGWGAFDHGEIWGRDGHPYFLVGMPYGVSADDLPLLGAFADAGFRVSVGDRSWHWVGTVLVLIKHPSVIHWPAEKDAEDRWTVPGSFDARSTLEPHRSYGFHAPCRGHRPSNHAQ